MKMTDIVKLSLAGKSPAEIRELMDIETELKGQEEAEPTKLFELTKPAEQTPTEETAPIKEAPKAEDPKDPTEPEPDYKALYEESQKQLLEAQKANRSADMSGGADPAQERQERIDNLVRQFM